MKYDVVLPAFNEAKNLPLIIEQIYRSTPSDGICRVIVVDDGSKDETEFVVRECMKSFGNLGYIRLSRNFGHQAALLAGIRESDGEFVITMDSDGQHPPEIIPQMINLWKSGSEIVVAQRSQSAAGFFKRVTSALFYRIFRALSELNIAESAADFRLIDNAIVKIISDATEYNLFLRGYIEWIGFRRGKLFYDERNRYSGDTKYSLRKMYELAVNGIVSFSVRPLRLILYTGIGIMLFSWLYLVYIVLNLVWGGTFEPGWGSLIVTVLFTSGLQMFFIGMIGEYAGRIFMQTKNRANYIIQKKIGL